MNFLREILDHNKKYLSRQQNEGPKPPISKIPSKEAAILTCMDTRLVGLLEEAIGKSRGECKIIKNAGGIVSHPFGGVMRSLVIAIYELQVSELVVIAHKDCGMCQLDPQRIEQKMIAAGVSPDTLRGIESTGLDLHKWFEGFKDPYESVKNSTQEIRFHPLVPDHFPVHGLVIDPVTGQLDLVVDGYEAIHQQTYEQYRRKPQG